MKVLAALLAISIVSAPVAAQKASTEQIGDWAYSVKRDAMTDQTTPYVAVGSQTGGLGTDGLYLAFFCNGVQAIAGIGLGSGLAMQMISMSSGQPTVQVRFGHAKPRPATTWMSSKDSPESLFKIGTEVDSMAIGAMTADTMVLRLWSPSGDVVTTRVIPIRGAKQAIHKLPCAPGNWLPLK